MVNVKRSKCPICDVRPVTNGGRFCNNCQSGIDAETARRTPRKAVKFLHYRGTVIGLFPKVKETGVLTAELVKRDVSKLPKSRTFDLDGYVPGFDREQIKGFKRTCLVLGG